MPRQIAGRGGAASPAPSLEEFVPPCGEIIATVSNGHTKVGGCSCYTDHARASLNRKGSTEPHRSRLETVTQREEVYQVILKPTQHTDSIKQSGRVPLLAAFELPGQIQTATVGNGQRTVGNGQRTVGNSQLCTTPRAQRATWYAGAGASNQWIITVSVCVCVYIYTLFIGIRWRVCVTTLPPPLPERNEQRSMPTPAGPLQQAPGPQPAPANTQLTLHTLNPTP